MGYKVMKEEIKYEAGVCNIGIDEIKKRKQAGWIGIITTIEDFEKPLFAY